MSLPRAAPGPRGRGASAPRAPRCQRGQLLQGLGGLEQQMRRAIAPCLPQLNQDAPIGEASQALLGQRR